MLEIGRVQGDSLDFDKDFVASDGGNGYIVLNAPPIASDGLVGRSIDEPGDNAAVGHKSLHSVQG